MLSRRAWKHATHYLARIYGLIPVRRMPTLLVGEVVWRHVMNMGVIIGFALGATVSVSFAQIPPGYELVEVASGPHYHRGAQMNNCGEIVFSIKLGSSWADSEVFLYDNGKLTQISYNDGRDVVPDINDDGTIVWSQGTGDADASRVILYQDGEATVFAEGTLEHPEIGAVINNLGHIAWNLQEAETCAFETSVMFYDGETVEQITDNGLSNQSIRLNDNDEMVWTRYHFCDVPWTSEIMRYANGVISELPLIGMYPQLPDLNDTGQVVWAGVEGIEILEDGETTMLRSGPKIGCPVINNRGDVYYIEKDDDLDAWQSWLYRDGEFYRLVSEPYWNTNGDINNTGECAWHWSNLPWSEAGGIRFLRRIRDGDVDFNDDVNLDDFTDLPGCLTGPVDTDHLCECRFFDIDHDRDVDLTDFASFQNRFGMQPSRDCCIPHDSPGCTDPVIEACVCDAVYLCCQPGWEWDEYCVSLVEILDCGACP